MLYKLNMLVTGVLSVIKLASIYNFFRFRVFCPIFNKTRGGLSTKFCNLHSISKFESKSVSRYYTNTVIYNIYENININYQNIEWQGSAVRRDPLNFYSRRFRPPPKKNFLRFIHPLAFLWFWLSRPAIFLVGVPVFQRRLILLP